MIFGMWTLIGLMLLWYFGREAVRAYRERKWRKAAERTFAVGAGLIPRK